MVATPDATRSAARTMAVLRDEVIVSWITWNGALVETLADPPSRCASEARSEAPTDA